MFSNRSPHLSELANRSIYIIREAYASYRNMALLWSMGKDSTTLLWLTRQAFFGQIPFPVIHIDTTYKFKEIYAFREKIVRAWGLNLIVSKNEAALKKSVNPQNGKLACCHALKTGALKQTIQKYNFQALLLAIRRDEHGIRAKERIFSPRNQNFLWNYENQPAEMWDMYKSRVESDNHFRVHPLLEWTELDVWEYIRQEKIPVVQDLYFARGGQRFRSIGCQTCCHPMPSRANSLNKIIRELKTIKIPEREGRAQDKEDTYAMQKLRSLGYM